jgi:hypothetical protein
MSYIAIDYGFIPSAAGFILYSLQMIQNLNDNNIENQITNKLQYCSK